MVANLPSGQRLSCERPGSVPVSEANDSCKTGLLQSSPNTSSNSSRLSLFRGITETSSSARLGSECRSGVLTDWHWYRDLTHQQRLLYEELMQIEAEIHLSPRDCKQLVKGLTRIGITTPVQLRHWFSSLAEADHDSSDDDFIDQV